MYKEKNGGVVMKLIKGQYDADSFFEMSLFFQTFK